MSMARLRGPIPVCPTDKKCLEWAHKYLKDCVCSTKDQVSFAVGLISVFFWGVAEVPQIITNFKEKSTEGISLAFLFTWIIGDIFNLAGCYLEPSTLPTQFYMALLYTLTTLILLGQVLFYGHFKTWRTKSAEHDNQDQGKIDTTIEPLLKPTEGSEANKVPEVPVPSKPIPAVQSPRIPMFGRDLYYTSARSLVSSYTPTAGSYIVGSRALSPLHPPASLHETNHTTRVVPAYSSPVFRAVISSSFCIGGFVFNSFTTLRPISHRLHHYSNSKILLVSTGRKLMQANYDEYHSTLLAESGEVDGTLGVFLGWLMAAIYMGGRVPQIWLNIKRGSVEGLNPLMFTFALLGNITYIGSILVRSTKWEKIKANIPWLVDAGACVVLDFFIICQFIYYCYVRKEPKESEENEHPMLK